MTISKTQIEKAKAQGFELTEDDDNFYASWGDQQVKGETVRETLKLAAELKSFLVEYPWFSVHINEDGEYVVASQGHGYSDAHADLGEALASALEECPEPPEGIEEEPEEAGSIVPPRYKTEYKARGDETRCGDWLCEAIDPWVTTPIIGKKGGRRKTTDLEALRVLCRANGVDKDWPNLNNGQRAMNMRNMLRAVVVNKGTITIPAQLSGDITRVKEADPSWLAWKRGSE